MNERIKTVYQKIIGMSLGIAMMAAATASHAVDPVITDKNFPGTFSGGVTIASEYFFRGISQTDDAPALQGEIGWSTDLNKYVSVGLGVWGSNVDFNDTDGATVELDYTASLSGTAAKVDWSGGLIYYSYPGANNTLNYNFYEIFGSLGYDFKLLSAKVGINHSFDYFGASGDATYISGGVTVPLGKFLEFTASVGHQSIEKEANFGQPDYLDWSVGVGANVAGLDLAVTYTDTDLSDANCSDACGMVIATVGKSF